MRIELANLADNLMSSLLAIVKVIIDNTDIIINRQRLNQFLEGY
jgi:hypothetical protein